MNKTVISSFQKLMNSDIALKDFLHEVNNMCFSETEKNSAIRLINAWSLYRLNSKFMYDFEIALRDFLMLTGVSIKIGAYTVSDFGQSIGLRDGENGKWVLQEYPEFIVQNFALKSAVAETIHYSKTSSYHLETNSFIRNLTGFNSFKTEEQKLCVMGALRAPEGSSVLVSMSTGGGKSLVTQTIAFQSEGLTIVIVPTVSLMIDQVSNARDILAEHKDEIQIYNSSSDFTKIKNALVRKKIKLLFLSPEALIKNQGLKEVINDLSADGWLKNLIIDEAHIIFEWGDSFRLDFQCVDVLRKNLIKLNPKLRTYLLSATFNQSNARLLKKFYSEDENWIELRCDSLRREIRYNFIKAKSFSDKKEKALELIVKLPHPMIVYVERPEEAKRVQLLLREKGIYNTNVFTGETSSKDREILIDKWKANEFQIMIATCAFGVGVDKKDVRTVLHLYMPDNINKYYQEAGRGGRDGKSSLSIILYTQDDEIGAFSFIRRKVLTTEKIIGRWFSMLNGNTSTKHGDGTATLDTSIKPNYAEQDDCVTISSTRDIDWNVYVLLFLKRHDLIEIEAIEYRNNNYYMLVKILNKTLFENNSKALELVAIHREEEWTDTEKAYKDMKKFLSKCNEQCVSDILLQQYSLIPREYCSGCNSHPDTVIKGSYSGLPLVSSVKMNPNSADDYLLDDSVLIVKTDDFNLLENKLLAKGVKSLVIDGLKQFSQDNQQKTDTIIFTIEEFKKLLDNKEYFLTKTILFECPENEDKIIKIMELIDRIRKKYGVQIILLTKDNYYINTFNKKLYEMIEASYREDYMIE